MLSKEEIEKAKEKWKVVVELRDGFLEKSPMIKAVGILLQYIDQLEQENIEAYWKGYIQKQQESMEICKMCKYRKQYFGEKVEEYPMEMNLEGTIKHLKYKVENNFVISRHNNKDYESIKRVLKELENSIPKKKIEDKISQLESTKFGRCVDTIEILEELLENK